MRQPEPAERRPDGRERDRPDAPPVQGVPDLGERDARLGGGQLPQQPFMPGQERPSVVADPGRAVPPVSRARRMIFTAADGLTSKRRAASRAELPASTALTKRRRRSWDRGAVITASPLTRERRIRSRDSEQPQTALVLCVAGLLPHARIGPHRVHWLGEDRAAGHRRGRPCRAPQRGQHIPGSVAPKPMRGSRRRPFRRGTPARFSDMVVQARIAPRRVVRGGGASRLRFQWRGLRSARRPADCFP